MFAATVDQKVKIQEHGAVLNTMSNMCVAHEAIHTDSKQKIVGPGFRSWQPVAHVTSVPDLYMYHRELALSYPTGCLPCCIFGTKVLRVLLFPLVLVGKCSEKCVSMRSWRLTCNCHARIEQ